MVSTKFESTKGLWHPKKRLPVIGGLRQSRALESVKVIADEGSSLQRRPGFRTQLLVVRYLSSSLQVPCASVVDGTEEEYQAEYRPLLSGKFE